jgi:hypothetical protein
MKLTGFFTAGLVMVAGLSPVAIATPAAAQRTVVTERTVVHRDVGPRYRQRVTTRRVCTNRWRNGHRQRVCRVVRVRR